jgi:hypothetical protein
MTTDATIILQNLLCIRESEGGSQPYIWPVLLRIDDTTLIRQPPDPVDVNGPALADARVVLKDEMREGDTAAIPFPLSTLGFSFENGLVTRQLLLVVALFEKDDTPEDAVWAGCKAFTGELDAALTEKLPELQLAVAQSQNGNPGPLNQLIQEMQERVKASVVKAIWDALPWWKKAEVVVNRAVLDDFMGFNYKYFPVPTRSTFSLSFSTAGTDAFRLDGMLDVRERAVDLCQAEVDAVNAAQKVVDGIRGQLDLLKVQLHHATPQQKASLVVAIEMLSQDLAAAHAALEEALQELVDCRDHWTKRSTGYTRVTEALT